MTNTDSNTFGLLGRFAGDEPKRARATQLAERLLGAQNNAVGVADVVAVLESLPFSGRIEFVLKVLCESPSRDRLVRALFDSCFTAPRAENAAEREPILESLSGVASRQLDPERYYLVRLLVVAMPKLGRLGVELFHEYQRTSSTVLFRAFLDAAVASTVFTDDELEAVFLGAVDVSRKAILDRCKHAPHRQRFVGRLIAKQHAPLSMLYWAAPEDVAALLSGGTPAQIAEFEQLGFGRWPHLGAVYLAHLRRRFEAHANDPIRKAKVLREFEARASELSSADVRALVALCEEHRPMEIAPSVGPAVRAYLEETSRRGALEGTYEGVTLALPCSRLLNQLSPEDRIALLRASTTKTARGWTFSESHRTLCEALLARRSSKESAKRLFTELACEAVGAASDEIVWDLRTGATTDATHKTFQSFEGFLDVGRWSQNRLALQGVEAWLALHQRTRPTPAVIARYQGRKSAVELWTIWTQQALGRVVELVESVAKRAAASLDRCSPRAPRSTITSYVPFVRILVEYVQSVLEVEGQRCDPFVHLTIAATVADATRELFARAERELRSEDSVGAKAVAALRSSVEVVLVGALRKLSASIAFDPTQEGYVTAAQHRVLAPALARICAAQQLSHFSALKRAAFDFSSELFDRVEVPAGAARLGFVESVRQQNTKSFAFFDLEAHKLWSGTALSLLAALRAACGAREADAELSSRVWALYKREKFSGRVPKRTEKKFNEYLLECLSLPPSVLAGEKPALVDAGVALLKANEFDGVADAFARAGWLLEVLDRDPPAQTVRDKYLLKHGDIATPAVRVLLEDATTDRDPALRFQAHMTLLNRSQHDANALAVSVAYVGRRIRNEAGLHRPQVYQWLIERMATIVARSLERAHEDRGAAPLEDIGVLCDALEKMLRDDVSKRDSVAKNAFRSIASTILSSALSFDPLRPALEARRRWIACGVLLDWIVVKTLHGDEGAQSFVWPLHGCSMPRERTVPEAWLESYLPFLRAHFRAGQGRFDELRVGLYTRRHHRESDAPPRFDVAQAVDLLVDALNAASQPESAAGARDRDELATAKSFPAGARAESTLLRRALALVSFAKTQWTDVPRLVKFFEAMVASLEAKDLDASQLRPVLALFEAVRALYPQGSLWYELPLLARACDGLLRAAIRLSLSDVANRVYPLWIELRHGQGRTPIGRELTQAQAQYLIGEGAVRDADVLESGSQSERRCASARELLERTPSAAYLVKDVLVSMRDDVLLEYTWTTRGALRGVFDPAFGGAPLTEAESAARAPLAIPSSVWPTLNGKTMRTYTVAALESALMVQRSPQLRSRDVSDFVQSPASSHAEVIDLLRRLLQLDATATQSADATPDDARELLLETVILCVFQTDAAWFVLAYLLSPDVIATSQRTTASILTNLHAWVAMDKVVAVLRILLEPKRRWALQVFLHKAILRLLFEAPSAGARRLFAHEWAQRITLKMHADVVHEMVRLAVGGLASTDADKSSIAWSIAEEVGRSRGEFAPTTVLLLLLPSWVPEQPFVGQRMIEPLFRIEVPNSEVIDSFGQLHSKWLAEPLLYFGATPVRDRMRALLEAVAEGPNPYLRTLAKCRGFALSPCAGGVEDAPSLEALKELLLSMSVSWEPERAPEFPKPGAGEGERAPARTPEAQYLLQVAPKLFAALGLQVLHKELLEYTEHERQTARALSDLCRKHAAARVLREVFGQCLEALATVAPIHIEKRTRLAMVAQGILSTANEWGSGKTLLVTHFQEGLRFLRADVERVTPLF
ncbi:MAG: hypothetical protein JNK05_38105 [Myxococcales bacterium]|nr:hypothetical protein [Myxococcales bacterium]